jgi:hypothetical protein
MNKLFVLFFSVLSSYSYASSLEFVKINEWGYSDIMHSKYDEYYCLGNFKPMIREYREIKSKQHSKELHDTFYRFTLIREVYKTPYDAKKRLSDINTNNFKNSVYSKTCALREGFLVGKTMYQVHTDVSAFRDELQAIVKRLKKHLNP